MILRMESYTVTDLGATEVLTCPAHSVIVNDGKVILEDDRLSRETVGNFSPDEARHVATSLAHALCEHPNEDFLFIT